LIPFAMGIPWRSSAEALAQIMRRHGTDPGAVGDVEAAWGAFGEFLHVEVDGIDPEPNSDADGFIVQWGRYSLNDQRPSLSFTRQLAVVDGGDRQPEYWQLDLHMIFDDGPELAGIDDLDIQDTGFSFEPIGPRRAAELAAMRTGMARYPQLSAVWRATPVGSALSFECVC